MYIFGLFPARKPLMNKKLHKSNRRKMCYLDKIIFLKKIILVNVNNYSLIVDVVDNPSNTKNNLSQQINGKREGFNKWFMCCNCCNKN